MDKRVAFTGKMCSGKDTAADFLVEKGYKKISFADPIRRLAQDVFGDWQGDKRRRFMQEIGAVGREIDPLLWVKPVVREIESNLDGKFVVNDIRFPNEYETLVNLGFSVYRIDVPEHIRLDRYRRRNNYTPSKSAMNDSSEISLDHYQFTSINGNCSIDEFRKTVSELIGI